MAASFSNAGENVVATFQHPFTMLIAGPTQSGKTTWFKNVLETGRVQPKPQRIIWLYAQWQPLYESMKTYVEFYQGIPEWLNQPDAINRQTTNLIVLDDLMDSAVDSKMVSSLFTEGSHHRNLSVVLFMQNVFPQGKQVRNISLNAQYIVLFRNPRDLRQVNYLAQQVFPQQWRDFVAFFNNETSKRSYTPIVLTMKTNTPEHMKVTVDTNNLERSSTAPPYGGFGPLSLASAVTPPIVMTPHQPTMMMTAGPPPPMQLPQVASSFSMQTAGSQREMEDITYGFDVFPSNTNVEQLKSEYRRYVLRSLALNSNALHQSIQSRIESKMFHGASIREVVEKVLEKRSTALKEVFDKPSEQFEDIVQSSEDEDEEEEEMEDEDGQQEEEQQQQNDDEALPPRYRGLPGVKTSSKVVSSNWSPYLEAQRMQHGYARDEGNSQSENDSQSDSGSSDEETSNYDHFLNRYTNLLITDQKMKVNPLHQSIMKRVEELQNTFYYDQDDAVYAAIEDRTPSFDKITAELQEEDEEVDDEEEDDDEEMDEQEEEQH